MKFIDRMAADSRGVALNHTAGLSTPQQVQMAFFAGFAVIDRMKEQFAYKNDCNALVRKTVQTSSGRGWESQYPHNPNRACYHCMFDIKEWAVRVHGPEFFAWMQENTTPTEIIFHVAEECAGRNARRRRLYNPPNGRCEYHSQTSTATNTKNLGAGALSNLERIRGEMEKSRGSASRN